MMIRQNGRKDMNRECQDLSTHASIVENWCLPTITFVHSAAKSTRLDPQDAPNVRIQPKCTNQLQPLWHISYSTALFAENQHSLVAIAKTAAID